MQSQVEAVAVSNEQDEEWAVFEARGAQHVLRKLLDDPNCPAADAVNARTMIRFLGSLDCRFEEIPYLYPEAAYFLQRVLSNYKIRDDDDSVFLVNYDNALATLNYNIKLLESIGTAQRQDS